METLTLRNSASSVKQMSWDFFIVVESMTWVPGRGGKGENSCILPSRVLYFLFWQETVRNTPTQLPQLRWKWLYQLHLLNVGIIQDCKDNDLRQISSDWCVLEGQMLHWCMTQVIHNSGTTATRLGGGSKGEREINISTCFSREKDITRGTQLVQTFQSLHNIFFSTQEQQMNCIKRSSSYSWERNIMSM